MAIKLIYRQGSFGREERLSSISAAVSRALDLMHRGNFYTAFAIHDGLGQPLLSGTEIIAEKRRQEFSEDRWKELEAARILSAKSRLRKFRPVLAA